MSHFALWEGFKVDGTELDLDRTGRRGVKDLRPKGGRQWAGRCAFVEPVFLRGAGIPPWSRCSIVLYVANPAK